MRRQTEIRESDKEKERGQNARVNQKATHAKIWGDWIQRSNIQGHETSKV